jgi:2TM domain
MNNIPGSTNDQRDEELWVVARKRASFRRHLVTYLVVNSFLWLIWAFTGAGNNSFFPWPIWPTLGWGVGLAFNYADAYMFDRKNAVEEEYQKLLRKKQQQ